MRIRSRTDAYGYHRHPVEVCDRVGRLKKFLARHAENQDVHKDASEVATAKYFVPSPRMTLGLATMLHSNFPITPTWHANSQGVRPGQICKGVTQAVIG
jgi:hypothetical protein